MLKYIETKVTFSEIPDEITLCINLTGCKNACLGCHSPYLAEDTGEELNEASLKTLIESNNGISCISFMGGDAEPAKIQQLARFITIEFPYLKTAWYSGKEVLPFIIENNLHDFDFIKLGPYKEDCGPLNKRTTNQRFYKVLHSKHHENELIDITQWFWNKEYDKNNN